LAGPGGLFLPPLVGQLLWAIGLLAVVTGLLWPERWPGSSGEYSPPTARWERDAAGNFVRVPLDAAAAGDPVQRLLAPTRLWLPLLVMILLIAAGLRFWQLATIPPGCVDSECANALRLTEGLPLTSAAGDRFNLFEQVAALLSNFTGGITALRLTSALFGMGLLLALTGLARRLANPPAALLTVALAAIAPWAIWAARTGDPWSAAALLLATTLWLVLNAFADPTVGRWTMAGLAAGLLWGEAGALRVAVLLSLIGAVGLGLWAAERRQRLATPYAFGAFLAVIAPLLAPSIAAGTIFFPAGGTTAPMSALPMTLTALLRPDSAALTVAVAAPIGLFPAFLGALTVAGLGIWLRNLRNPAALWLLLTTTVFIGGLARVDLAQLSPISVALPFFTLAMAATAAYLDRLAMVAVAALHPLLRPRPVMLALGLLVAMLALPATLQLVQALNGVQSAGPGAVEMEMARFLAEDLAADNARSGDTTTWVVAPAVLRSPGTRLLAGPALAAGRLLPLEPGRTLPWSGVLPGDLVYVTGLSDRQVIDQLQQLYPEVQSEVRRNADDQAIFTVSRVAASAIDGARGAQMLLFTTPQPGLDSEAAVVAIVDSLSFPWSSTPPPVAAPFSARWRAALVVRENTTYRFRMASAAADAGYSLTLDNQLVLDSSLQLSETAVPLAQGIYRLELVYRSGAAPADVALLWGPVDAGEPLVLGGDALLNRQLGGAGLMAEYHSGTSLDGPVIDLRKESIPGLDPNLPRPYTVRWSGKLAAPRAGEYMLSAVADGVNQLILDDILIVNGLLPEEGHQPGEIFYSEGQVYLTAGWHDLEIRYTPADTGAATGAGYRLLWQPPGSAPAEVLAHFLSPVTQETAPGDLSLPSAPLLVDERLGNERFALTQLNTAWQPEMRILPADLPGLDAIKLWQVGACGSAEDQFSQPRGVQFSPDGQTIWVADSGNRRVILFDRMGKPTAALGGAPLEEPVEIAFDPDGVPMILDAVGPPIVQVVEGGLIPLPVQASFYRPRGFAVDELGTILVADTGGARVVVLEPTGDFAAELGGQGSSLGAGQPVDAVFTNGAIWAVTAEDGRLWNVSVDAGLTLLPRTDTVNGPHLTELPGGRMLLSDPLNNGIWLLEGTGEPVRYFTYPAELMQPTGIDARLEGNMLYLAVTDSATCTLSLWQTPAP
jgi:DNA-binding beta-propeller fold protein YncE